MRSESKQTMYLIALLSLRDFVDTAFTQSPGVSKNAKVFIAFLTHDCSGSERFADFRAHCTITKSGTKPHEISTCLWLRAARKSTAVHCQNVCGHWAELIFCRMLLILIHLFRDKYVFKFTFWCVNLICHLLTLQFCRYFQEVFW